MPYFAHTTLDDQDNVERLQKLLSILFGHACIDLDSPSRLGDVAISRKVCCGNFPCLYC